MYKHNSILIWIGALLLSLILLLGRYDWSNSFDSKISYALSAYFLIISLPTFYYSLVCYIDNVRLVIGITVIFALVLLLPYRWLGLEKYTINNTFEIPPPSWKAAFDWFPAAFNHLPAIPHEGEFFVFLILIGLSGAFILWRKERVPNNLIVYGLLLYILILIQTWLHLSLRSPYTYAGSLSGPNPWPVYYLFPDGKGAVNGDYPVHRSIEQLFMGTPGHLLLIKRSFYYYLTAQLSYFFHPYYIALVFNVGLWFCAVICGYGFVRRLWDEETGLIAAGLIACGTGFIYFVAQPMSYLAGYALFSILIYLFQTLVVEKSDSLGRSCLFGAILGLSSLVYEITIPIYIFILGYGILQGIKWRNLLSIVLLSVLIYFGYILLIVYGFNQSLDPAPFQPPTPHIRERMNLILSGDLNQVYLLLTQLVVLFWGGLGNAFFVIPVLISILGLFLVHGQHKVLIVLLLFSMPLFWVVLFHSLDVTFQDWLPYSTIPRYSYIGYPAIYLLVALFLKSLSGYFINLKQHTIPAGKFAMYFILAGIFILNNIDVWGVQSPYFLFYFLYPTLLR